MPVSSSVPDRPGSTIGLIGAGWSPDVGGVETHTRLIAHELVRRGWRVEALALDGAREGTPYEACDTRVEGVGLRRIHYRYHDHRALADLVRRDAAERVVLEWVSQRNIDRVHIHHATGFGTSVIEALVRSGRRVFASLHDYWTLCPRGQMWSTSGDVCRRPEPETCGPCLASTWPYLMPSMDGEARSPRGDSLWDDVQAAQARTDFALQCLGFCEALIVPSAAAARIFAGAGVPFESLCVLPNAVESKSYGKAWSERRPSRRESHDRIVFGVLGIVQPTKGVLEFARLILGSGDARLQLEVHGPRPAYHGDSSYVQELEALAARHDQIELFPAFEPRLLPDVLARLDALAVPSRWQEVFGLSAREARAAGLPVLASRRGGLLELESDPGVRLVAGDGDVDWGRALQDFVADLPALRELPRPCDSSWSVEVLVDQLEQIYRGSATAGRAFHSCAPSPG